MTLAAATPELLNTSNGVVSGFGDSSGLAGPLVILAYIVGAIIVVQLAAPWLARNHIVERVLGPLAASLEYAAKGLGASAALLAIAAPVYLVGTADGDTQGLALTALLGLAGVYLTLVVVGYLADHAVQQFIDAHPDLENWHDIWHGTGEDTEVAD